MSDFDFEPVRGLPELLPPGERMIWQGAPEFCRLAESAFKARLVGGYFLVLLAWSLASGLHDGVTLGSVISSLGLFALLAAAAIGTLLTLAWASARSTVYTITSERVVMRFGIALPMTINFPFRRIVRASLKAYPDGSGDIPLELGPQDKVAYVVLWPHARPRFYARPEPMLRAIPDAAKVAGLLAAAMEAAERKTTRSAEEIALKGSAANDDTRLVLKEPVVAAE